MARKGNQHKNGLDRNTSNQKSRDPETCADSVKVDKKETVEPSDGKVVGSEQLPNGGSNAKRRNKKRSAGEGKDNKQRPKETFVEDKQRVDTKADILQSASISNGPREVDGHVDRSDASDFAGENGPSVSGDQNLRTPVDSIRHGFHSANMRGSPGSSDTILGRNLGELVVSFLKVVNGWLERKKPLLTSITTILMDTRDYVRLKILQAYPIVCRWLMHLGNLVMLVSLVWLDCSLRGLGSFLRLGTTSFFAVIWCGIFSVFAMIGIWKFLMIMGVAIVLALFVGFIPGILVLAISATVSLWICGSFWTTGLVIVVGGLGFLLKSERFALLITTIYSVYCAWIYVGWLGLFAALNVSFISSDVLIHFLKNNVSEHGRSYERNPNMQGPPGSFSAAPMNSSPFETGFGKPADRNAGEPSTSGSETELTSEEEVVRLLNSPDHYSALGLARYENIDMSLLKREYRKKAMLVHPDKNMGDEKAVEAFKKLQNAYEVLLDSLKREAYNDELRKEELINWFRRSQSSSQMSGRHDHFASGFTQFEGDDGEPLGDFRRIACRKCRQFHIWVLVNRPKSQARWCQECNDCHPAKDGDGWVEQSSKPFFFGMLQKVDAPLAYVCAESRIYNATAWFSCQGMRCPANTHKPSFHVNTSVTSSKHGPTKGNGGSGQKWAGGIPPNMDENMTEDEFVEWLQNAMQSGMFEAAAGGNPPQPDSPFSGAKNFNKTPGSGAGCSSSSGNNKKKRKGKKQW
ncbi:hypothetical protein MKW92_027255 [Papaver armeniacum]|nr:hypothetical protein MKW92_027255 [Papaver armeniacum]